MYISLSSLWALSAYSTATSRPRALKDSVLLLGAWRSDSCFGGCSYIPVTFCATVEIHYTLKGKK